MSTSIHRFGAVQRDILWVLEDKAYHTAASIIIDIDRPYQSIYTALRSLTAKGLIVRSDGLPQPNRCGGRQTVARWRLA